MAKHRLTITSKELGTLAHIMRQFSDYVAGDDRPDHGLANLKPYRKLPKESKWELYILTGKINRLYHKSQRRIIASRLEKESQDTGEGDVI